MRYIIAIVLALAVCPAMCQVTGMEYFIDTDPGYSKATTISVTAGTNITTAFTVPLASQPNGFHTLGVRAKDAQGHWSLTSLHPFFVLAAAATAISSAEYYVDTDPGYGKGTAASTTQGTDGFLHFVLPLSAYSKGFHTLGLRSKDNAGRWSETIQYVFTINGDKTPVNITSIQYYFTGAGATNDTYTYTIPNPSPSVDVNFTADLSHLLADSEYTMHFVAISSEGSRSEEYTKDVILCNGDLAVPKYDSAIHSTDYMVQLDGVNDYVDFGTWFKVPQFTVSFWVNPDSLQTQGATIAALQNDLYLYDNPTTGVQNNYILSHLLQFDLLPNQWNHVTITADSATQIRKVYLFGQLIDSNRWAYNPVAGFDLRFGNGGFFPNAYFKGQFDEVKLWNKVLPQEDIVTNVTKELSGSESGLIGYWNFNDGCNVVANDLSQGGHLGILKNGTLKLPSTVPSVGQQIVPNIAGTSTVTVKIYDNLFQQGAVTKLTRSGLTDIIADTTVISIDGTTATCTFNLYGKDTGLYNVIVSNPDKTEKTYTNSFTIVKSDTLGGVDVQLLGSNIIRNGSTRKFLIVYQNKNNVNVYAPGFSLQSDKKDYIAFSSEDLEYKWQILPVILGNQTYKVDSSDGVTYDSILSPGVIYTIPVYVQNDPNNALLSKRLNDELSPCEELSNFILTSAYPNRTDFHGNDGHVNLPYGPNDNDGHNFIDGCSTGILSVDPYFKYWNQIFMDDCAKHDMCYQSCYQRLIPGNGINLRVREICNTQFYQDMIETCKTYPGSIDDCNKAALHYYQGVTLLGLPSFETDQSYCTGGISEPPLKGSSALYYIPDCDHGCPVNSICYTQTLIGSFDPNEKIGPSKFQNLTSDFNYLINFENKSTATAPAQEVTVIDTLDKTKFDINTFSFGLFGFGDTVSQSTYQYNKTFVQYIDLRPANNLIVEVEGRLDTLQNIAYWKFYSLDPATMQLTQDPEAGFLPPSDSLSMNGDGWVSYSIKPYSYLESDTSIKNSATIIFDNNAPISTGNYENVVDKISPVSNVQPLPAQENDNTFNVQWAGTDNVSGIQGYDVYYSVNGGAYQLWKSDTLGTQALFTGKADSTYRFYSIATDSADNIEMSKTQAEAITTVANNGMLLTAKAFMQGPYVAAEGLMTDSLRAKKLIPLTEPYTGLGFTSVTSTLGKTISAGLLDNTGTKAITDWIWIELRSAANSKVVVASRAALIQRSGNIVDTDGVSPVYFNGVQAGSYYVAIRHRNHLGVMSSTAIAFTKGMAAAADFTQPTFVTYGTNAQQNSNGVMEMWAGDANGNALVTYNGSNNDKNAILSVVGLFTTNNIVSGYLRADCSLDGKVSYNGAANDKNKVLTSVGLLTPNNVITEQLPK